MKKEKFIGKSLSELQNIAEGRADSEISDLVSDIENGILYENSDMSPEKKKAYQ